MTAQELLKAVAAMRVSNREYVSNAFFTVVQLEGILNDPHVVLLQNDDLLALVEQTEEMRRLYFYARSIQALDCLKTLLPKNALPMIADVVGRDPGALAVAQSMECHGFALYSTFVRMSCTRPLVPHGDVNDVCAARVEDAEIIERLLRQEFDPLFSHFPCLSAIRDSIEKGEITVCRMDGRLAGFAWFERISSKNSLLRYFVVDRAYRGRRVGGALLAKEFAHEEESRVYILWVGTYNSAQGMYQKLGFRRDGLMDYIMRYVE